MDIWMTYKIWMTYRNADMTEGRGPMIADEAFLHREHAAEYIDEQPGVMGRRQKWSEKPYGDWNMVETTVHGYSLLQKRKQEEEDKKNALKKLTAYERKLLGLSE